MTYCMEMTYLTLVTTDMGAIGNLPTILVFGRNPAGIRARDRQLCHLLREHVPCT